MKDIHLNLKRKWFNMILSGEKKEEYREIKPSFCARFLLVRGEHKKASWWKTYIDMWGIEETIHLINGKHTEWKHYDTNTFSNGMTPPVPRFTVEHKGIKIKEGNQDWGASKGVKYFVITL